MELRITGPFSASKPGWKSDARCLDTIESRTTAFSVLHWRLSKGKFDGSMTGTCGGRSWSGTGRSGKVSALGLLPELKLLLLLREEGRSSIAVELKNDRFDWRAFRDWGNREAVGDGEGPGEVDPAALRGAETEISVLMMDASSDLAPPPELA